MGLFLLFVHSFILSLFSHPFIHFILVLLLSFHVSLFRFISAGIEGRSGRERQCFEFDLRGVGSAVSKLSEGL